MIEYNPKYIIKTKLRISLLFGPNVTVKNGIKWNRMLSQYQFYRVPKAANDMEFGIIK